MATFISIYLFIFIYTYKIYLYLYLFISVANTMFDFSYKLPETTIDNLMSQNLYFQISELDSGS